MKPPPFWISACWMAYAALPLAVIAWVAGVSLDGAFQVLSVLYVPAVATGLRIEQWIQRRPPPPFWVGACGMVYAALPLAVLAWAARDYRSAAWNLLCVIYVPGLVTGSRVQEWLARR